MNHAFGKLERAHGYVGFWSSISELILCYQQINILITQSKYAIVDQVNAEKKKGLERRVNKREKDCSKFRQISCMFEIWLVLNRTDFYCLLLKNTILEVSMATASS